VTMAGTEKRRSTEQRNPVTIGVTATQDSIFDWRELGAQVTHHRFQTVILMRGSRSTLPEITHIFRHRPDVEPGVHPSAEVAARYLECALRLSIKSLQ
jgi:hypothetical protein